MRGIVQRVRRAAVSVEGEPIREIGEGIVLLVGVGDGQFTRAGVAIARLGRSVRARKIAFDGAGAEPKVHVRDYGTDA